MTANSGSRAGGHCSRAVLLFMKLAVLRDEDGKRQHQDANRPKGYQADAGSRADGCDANQRQRAPGTLSVGTIAYEHKAVRQRRAVSSAAPADGCRSQARDFSRGVLSAPQGLGFRECRGLVRTPFVAHRTRVFFAGGSFAAGAGCPAPAVPDATPTPAGSDAACPTAATPSCRSTAARNSCCIRVRTAVQEQEFALVS